MYANLKLYVNYGIIYGEYVVGWFDLYIFLKGGSSL